MLFLSLFVIGFGQSQSRFDALRITNIREIEKFPETEEYCGECGISTIAITLKNSSGKDLIITDLEIDAFRQMNVPTIPTDNKKKSEIKTPSTRSKDPILWIAKVPKHEENYTYTYHPEKQDTIIKNGEQITIHLVLMEQGSVQLPQGAIFNLRFKTDQDKIFAQKNSVYFKDSRLMIKK